MKIGTIADLIRYRLEKERSVERIAERDVETDFGAFRLHCYEDHVNGTVHLAHPGEARHGTAHRRCGARPAVAGPLDAPLADAPPDPTAAEPTS